MGVRGRPRALTPEQEQILLAKVNSEARQQKAMTAIEVASEVSIDTNTYYQLSSKTNSIQSLLVHFRLHQC